MKLFIQLKMALSRRVIVKNKDSLDRLISYCIKTGYCSFDFETTSVEYYREGEYPTVLAVCFQPGISYIIPLGHSASPFKNNYVEILQYFGKKVLENPQVVKIAWNLQFELNWCRTYSIYPKGRLFDAMIAKYLLDETRPNDLKSMVARFIPEFAGYDDEVDLLARKHGWANIPFEPLTKYAGIDADMELRLWLKFEPLLIQKGLYKLFRNLMMPALQVLSESAFNGVNINEERLLELRSIYEKETEDIIFKLTHNPKFVKYDKARKKNALKYYIAELQNEISELRDQARSDRGAARKIANRESKIQNITLGQNLTKKEEKLFEPFNFGSQTQLKDLLFLNPKGFRFKIVKYTLDQYKNSTGNPSTDEEVLEKLKLKDDSGFIELMLKHREILHIRSNFIESYLEKLYKGKLHPSFLLHGTVCISEDTPLMTNRGRIIIGDLIPKEIGVKDISDLGLETITHRRRFKKITQAVNKGYHDMVKITTQMGNTLKCTPHHKIYTPKGWKSVNDCFNESLEIWGYNLPILKEMPKTQKPKEEIIKPIEGFMGYFISNLGNVFTNKIPGTRGVIGVESNKMVSRVTKKYNRVGLRNNLSKKFNFKVSRLVYQAFKGDIPSGYQVDHIDCNPLNDNINNLRVVKYKENLSRAFDFNIKAHSRMLTHNQIFYSDKIISMDYLGKQLVCDITVEGDHSYVANNIIHHNSGRLSSRNPNAQQVPRVTTNPHIKPLFIPSPGKLIMQMDYSQAELRVLASMAQEKEMIRWFAEGRDIHLSSACKKYKVDYNTIKPILKDENHPEHTTWVIRRKQAKQINFGIVYGQGAKMLAGSLSSIGVEVTEEQAQKFLDDFFKEFPQIRKFIKMQHRKALKYGFVTSPFGRKRRLPEINSPNWGVKAEAQRQSVNAPIQGTASDYTLFASVLIWEKIKSGLLPLGMKQLITVHDSLIFELYPEDIHEVIRIIKPLCEYPETKEWFDFELKGITMAVDFEIGTTWGDLKDYDENIDYTTWV